MTEKGPTLRGHIRSFRVARLLVKGSTDLARGRYEPALADVSRAIKLDPEYPLAIASRGQLLQRMERYEEALADFVSAIL